ncbi:MAG TPA: hypothetical protein VGH82_00340 [Gaiellaceae bacterium]|jgi:hypothetical protein
MARKSVADQAKAKAEKQKKTLIVLAVVLAGALAYGVHTMMSLNSSGGPKPEAAPVTTTPTSAPATSSTPLPAAPTLSGVTPTGTSAPASSGSISQQLVSAVQAPANVGQLQSFSLFESKDPFHAGGPGSSTSGTSGGSGTGSKGSGTTSKPPKAPPAPPAPPTPPPTSAVISVNGSSEMVLTGANFPAATPEFQLVSLTDTTAKVAVAGGSYASGAPTLTLKVNVPVTLVNTADGTRYTLELYPQGTVAPTESSSSGSTTTTDTTPATTTTTGG